MPLRVAVCACACACLFFLSPALADTAPVVLHDTEVLVDHELWRGTDAGLHVAVFGARSLTERSPVAGADVIVSIRDVPGKSAQSRQPRAAAAAGAPSRVLVRGKTGPDGALAVRFPVPGDLPLGRYELSIDTRSSHGESSYKQLVTVSEATALHVRTDRGMYQPGQKIGWRVIALRRPNAHPLAGASVDVSVLDARHSPIWRDRVTTDENGMAHGMLPLGEEISLGEYTVEAHLGETTADTTVRVRRYELPPFTVAIELDRPGQVAPGSTIAGAVVARYPSGEPVAGQAVLRARARSATSQSVPLVLDAHGRARFTRRVPDDATWFELVAEVEDGATRKQRADLDVPVQPGKLAVAVVPERPALLPGVKQWVTIITTNRDGELAAATVDVAISGQNSGASGSSTSKQTYESPGAIRVAVTPQSNRDQPIELTVDARAGKGTRTSPVKARFEIPLVPDAKHWIQLDEAVIRGGDAITLTGHWHSARGPVVVTLLSGMAPIAQTTATIDKSGRLRARVRPPDGVFGLLTIRTAAADWDDHTGETSTIIQQAPLYIHPTQVNIAISGALRHRPGENARLDVVVRDHDGKPVPGAGIAAAVVDERALALAGNGPDLVTVLRNLDSEKISDEVQNDSLEDGGLAFAALLGREDTPAVRAAMRAILEALPARNVAPITDVSAARRVQSELLRAREIYSAVSSALITLDRPIGQKLADRHWDFADSLDTILAGKGWSAERRLTPWRQPTSFAYARYFMPDLTFEAMAVGIADERLIRLIQALGKNQQALRRDGYDRLVARGVLPYHLTVDPWGKAIQVVALKGGKDRNGKTIISYSVKSAGPDGVFSTSDDLVYDDIGGEDVGWGTIGTGRYGSIGYGAGSGSGGMYGRASAVPEVRIGAAMGAGEPAIRDRFDETVLWASGLRTDASGRVSLEVLLADSITGWHVELEALTPRGAAGVARTRLETWQPLHVDAEVPQHLAIGDRYALSVVIANHTDRSRKLDVTVTLSGAVRAGTATPRRQVALPPRSTTAFPFEVEAHEAGTGNVLLTLAEPGKGTVDRVARAITVDPPGSLVEVAYTADGTGKQRSTPGTPGTPGSDGLGFAFTLPADHLPGTTRATLRVFRGAVDQALDGLEGMLSEPHGCFEQTSSSTYPNLLVLRLLGDDTRMASVRARAYDLVARGYQRLISFEVPGGGFSWFGEDPASLVLTAYGLMEFVDMAEVYPVDGKLIERTRDWLLDQQKKSGAFKADEHFTVDWKAELATTAYVAWALAETGYRGKKLDRALGYLRAHRAAMARSPYLLSLWAAADSARGVTDSPALVDLLQRGKDTANGLHVAAGGATLFFAEDKSADVQTTALVALALGRSQDPGRAEKALRWLWSARSKNYGWGDTQSTVLALRARAAVAAPPASALPRSVAVKVDGAAAGTIDLESIAVPSLDVSGAITATRGQGRHQVEIDAGRGLRADLRLSWRTRDVAPARAHGLAVTLTANEFPAQVGGRKDMAVRLENPGKSRVAMPTVVIPVPAGFRLVRSTLDALVTSKKIARYEDEGSEIHIYLTELAAGREIVLPYKLEATAACDVLQRPARAYAFYNPDVHGTSASLRLAATPRPGPR